MSNGGRGKDAAGGLKGYSLADEIRPSEVEKGQLKQG